MDSSNTCPEIQRSVVDMKRYVEDGTETLRDQVREGRQVASAVRSLQVGPVHDPVRAVLLTPTLEYSG